MFLEEQQTELKENGAESVTLTGDQNSEQVAEVKVEGDETHVTMETEEAKTDSTAVEQETKEGKYHVGRKTFTC